MPDRQRIVVVSTGATPEDLEEVRVGRRPVVLTAPTPEARRLAGTFGAEPRDEGMLAPITPAPGRGHRLDSFVRRHAMEDRFRDVVVVADRQTTSLLLQVLAPDHAPGGGAVTVVGLARGDRPVSVLRAGVLGVLLGAVAVAGDGPVKILGLPLAVAVVGLVLLLVRPVRHVGRELLMTAGIAVVVLFLTIAGSARFPGAW